MKDIHDIKGLIAIPIPWLSFLLLAFFVLSLCSLAVWFFWRWRKNRQTKPVIAKPINKEDAYQQALNALQNLKPQEHTPGQFYLELEAIFKNLLQVYSEHRISSYTASQLQVFLHDHHLNSPQIQACLQHGLQAKFAAQSISDQLMLQDRDALRHWLSEHKKHLLNL